MNDAVYKFKRYEDASLSYTGIDCHEGEDRGGWVARNPNSWVFNLCIIAL